MSMLENRLNKIMKKGKENKIEQDKQDKLAREYRESLYKQIREFAPRIKDLLVLGNELYKNGLLGNKKDNYFYTDGWYHYVGFNRVDYKFKFDAGEEPIKFIGVECGGACGDIDLFVGGQGEIIAVSNSVGVNTDMIDLWPLERFVNGFEKFENKLLNYIDSL